MKTKYNVTFDDGEISSEQMPRNVRIVISEDGDISLYFVQTNIHKSKLLVIDTSGEIKIRGFGIDNNDDFKIIGDVL